MEPFELTDGIEKYIEKHGVVVCTTSGLSMYPFLKHRRDVVVIQKINGAVKKYDVLLYIDRSGRYVLHRLVKTDRDGRLYIRGDNCTIGEFVNKEKLIGILTEFTRKGKDGSTADKKFKLCSRIIVFLHPLVCVKFALLTFASKVKRVLTRKKSV